MWENYLSIERLKHQQDKELHSNSYFWRTYDGLEVDLVEESSGKLDGYEFKWQNSKTNKNQLAWQKLHPEAGYQVINKDNFKAFIT